MKKVLILDDQTATLKYLSMIVEDLETKCEVVPFDNVKDAYQCALEKKIDLFVIDIILDSSSPGDTSGLKFVENIRHVEGYSFTPVIFVTSLEDLRSYTYEKLHCYSYIEKPFDADKVKRTVEHCLTFPGGESREKTLYFRKDGIILAVDQSDIVYVECMHHKMYIHTKQKDVMDIPYMTLKKMLEELDSPNMIQCSRSAIINLQYVQNVDIPNRIIQLKNDYGRVEIGVRYKKYVKELFA